MEIKINELTPELFLYLYTSVDWEPPENKTGERSTKKYNGCICCLWNNTEIGMVRLIGDGVYHFIL